MPWGKGTRVDAGRQRPATGTARRKMPRYSAPGAAGAAYRGQPPAGPPPAALPVPLSRVTLPRRDSPAAASRAAASRETSAPGAAAAAAEGARRRRGRAPMARPAERCAGRRGASEQAALSGPWCLRPRPRPRRCCRPRRAAPRRSARRRQCGAAERGPARGRDGATAGRAPAAERARPPPPRARHGTARHGTAPRSRPARRPLAPHCLPRARTGGPLPSPSSPTRGAALHGPPLRRGTRTRCASRGAHGSGATGDMCHPLAATHCCGYHPAPHCGQSAGAALPAPLCGPHPGERIYWGAQADIDLHGNQSPELLRCFCPHCSP